MKIPFKKTARVSMGRFKAAVLLTLGATLISGGATAASTFVLESPGIVLDTVTNLEWEQDASAQGIDLNGVNFFGAQAYVTGLALDAAGGPWRLPTAAELKALYTNLAATGVCGHGIDCTGNRAPFSNIQDNYWTSSLSTTPGANRQAVSFLSGGQGPAAVDFNIAVWAVRENSLNNAPEPGSGMLALASLLVASLVLHLVRQNIARIGTIQHPLLPLAGNIRTPQHLPAFAPARRSKLPAITAFALFTLSTLPLFAQSNPCAKSTLSSVQFPLWNDGIGWNQPGDYSTIQLADIDGDGQDELLGYGPFGIEAWHWEANGQTWVKITSDTPPFAPADTLMTADVDGDGRAEVIQITPNTSTQGSPVINVWHYDVTPGVWRILPNLRLTLDPSGNSNVAVAPMIQFADLNRSGRKELVYLWETYQTLTPIVYQVKADGSGWIQSVSPGTSVPAADILLGGSFQIGDVNADGVADLVYRRGTKGFDIFARQLSSGGGSIVFSASDFVTLLDTFVPNFTLSDLAFTGFNYVVTVIQSAGKAYLMPLRYAKGTPYLIPVTSLAIPTSASTDPSVYLTLQAAHTGFNAQTVAGGTVQMLNAGGLAEYGLQNLAGQATLVNVSNTPFVSPTRFGDDPSHYKTIQSGKVIYNGSLQPILIARDANGIHTLTKTNNVCQTGNPGFSLPQLATPNYFPAFTASQQPAYSYISNKLVRGNFNIRNIYANSFASLPSYQASLESLTYPANQSTLPKASRFSQADFDAVKARLNAELLAAANTVAYFDTSNAQINSLFNDQEAALQTILTALNLPTDQTFNADTPTGLLISDVLNQVVSSLFFSFGLSDANAAHLGTDSAGANGAAIAVSIIGDVIDDVQSFQGLPSGGGSLGGSTLVIQNFLTSLHSGANTQNAIAQTRFLQNWDLMQALSQQIGDGTLTLSSLEEDQAISSALTNFQLTTWKALAPQVWEVFPAFGSPQNFKIGTSYPYYTTGKGSTVGSCGRAGACPVPTDYVVFLDTGGPNSPLFPNPQPVNTAALDQLTALGVDFRDVLGQRNGWENIPSDSGSWYNQVYRNAHWAVPADLPPVVPPPPIIGAPASLTIISGGQETSQTFSCNGNQSPVFLQSTPVNSVFPDPFLFQVLDINGNPVPGATVLLPASASVASPVSAITDANGFATMTILAGGIVSPNDEHIVVRVSNPAADSSVTACSVVQRIALQVLPSTGPGTGPTSILTSDSISAKSGIATARNWTVQIGDKTQSASGMQLNNLTFTQTRGNACNPVLMSPLPVVMSSPNGDGTFVATATIDFSSCSGLAFFTVGVDATATITLTDGAAYSVPAPGTISNVTP